MSAKSVAETRSKRALRAAEAMLAHLHPREDTNALMDALEEHFGSADALFRADPHMLENLGVHPNDALLMNRLPELSRLTRRVHFEKFPRLGRLDDASKYLTNAFYGIHVERFYLFCLDARGKLKEQVLLHEGTVDSALFNLRKMLSAVTRTRADAVLLSHNHPGLTTRPSNADIACTEDAILALTAVGIPLLDHVIVAGDQVVSMRRDGFVRTSMWLNQSPNHRLLYGWLEDSDN